MRNMESVVGCVPGVPESHKSHEGPGFGRQRMRLLRPAAPTLFTLDPHPESGYSRFTFSQNFVASRTATVSTQLEPYCEGRHERHLQVSHRHQANR